MLKIGSIRYLRWKNGSQINQYITAVLVAFPLLMIGMIMGWVSPALPQLQSPTGPFQHPISDAHTSLLSSILYLVSIPLMLVSGLLADYIGRKYAIMIASLSFVICWVIHLSSYRSDVFIFGRAVSGIGNALSFVVAPMYIKEISDDNIRGALGSLIILSQNVGIVLIYVIGDLLSFTTVLLVCCLLPLIHLILFSNIPETPSFLVKKRKIKEATKVLAWLRSRSPSDGNITDEIAKLSAQENTGHDEEIPPWKELVSNRTALKASVLCGILLLVQECNGCLILLTFASEVFAKADIGSALTPNQQTIVLGVVQVLGSIVASSLVEKTGRRLLLIIMSLLTGIGMVILGSCFFLNSKGINTPGWLPVAAMCLSIFSNAAGFQPTPYIILPEMFRFKLRGLVSSMAISLTAIGDFLQTESYETVTKAVGPQGTFWIFSAVCFFGTIFTVFFIPETKDKNLDEIYACLEGREVKKIENLEISVL